MADLITKYLSTELYEYMCQHIVGTEDRVKQIRLLNALRDNLSICGDRICITSGSFGEGLEMRGSDLDMMFVQRNIEVYDVKPRLNPNISYLFMNTDYDVKPGFTQLTLEYSNNQTIFDKCVQFGDTLYLSSTLWKQRSMVHIGNGAIIHGPCISDKNGLADVAECLHCKSWIKPALQWTTRSNNSWPSNNVKQSIMKHGVLFVPIGVKGSQKENLEWRISFSVGEKLLINTFTHTQLLCYALLKIVLKDVIATYSECEDLLCSYFLKTILFWISEELPQSAWKPDKLIPCFMQCFSRLIYCVEYSVCLHYFIPENNMFENKIEGRARKIILEKLYTLHSYGWRCILLSDQISSFPASIGCLNTEQHRLYVNDVEKIINSAILQGANSCFTQVFFKCYALHSSSFSRGIQKAVLCDMSAVKHVYTYYISKICSVSAQSIPLYSAYSNNKYRYRQYKSCLCILLQNIYHDAVSGWLMLASFFYKTKQFDTALPIILYSTSKCTFEKLCYAMNMSDIHHKLFKLKSLQKMSIVHWLQFILVDFTTFVPSSLLIPDELQTEGDTQPLSIPSSAYACFLRFLCHFHLNNVRQCEDTLQDLQLVISENHLIGNSAIKALAYNLLGIAFQLLGDTEAARKALLQSIELLPQSSLNPAVQRLFCMD